MIQYWLEVTYLGFERVFITGAIEGNDDYILELNESQKANLEAFRYKQREEEQNFLFELINEV